MYSTAGSKFVDGKRYSLRLNPPQNEWEEEYYVCRAKFYYPDNLNLKIENSLDVFEKEWDNGRFMYEKIRCIYYLVAHPVPLQRDKEYYKMLSQSLAKPITDAIEKRRDSLEGARFNQDYEICCNCARLCDDCWIDEGPKNFASVPVAEKVPDEIVRMWRKRWPQLTPEVFVDIAKDSKILVQACMNHIRVYYNSADRLILFS